MMLDWNTYRKGVLASITEIGKTNPEITRGYQGLSNAGAKTGKLDAKTRELIALAVAVTRQCDGCITTHVDAAIRYGAAQVFYAKFSIQDTALLYLCDVGRQPVAMVDLSRAMALPNAGTLGSHR